MCYKVQFVGLVCFLKEGTERRALLPNGTNPGPGIRAHKATICIPKGTVVPGSETGWKKGEIKRMNLMSKYSFPASDISLSGADTPGRLDASAHDGRLPSLQWSNPNVTVDPHEADVIADIPIRQGRLEAFRLPGSKDDGKAALISELEVHHQGDITITVTARDGSGTRTVTVNGGTEIAIVNASEIVVVPANENHFELYARLCTPRPNTLSGPDETDWRIPRSHSDHPVFRTGKPMGSSPRCTNTGCCP